MVITYNDDGLENLDSFSYIYSRDIFKKYNLYFKFVLSCKECGESFFMRLTYPTNLCSKKCAHNSKEVRAKISKSSIGRIKSEEERRSISIRKSKGGVVVNNIPLFKTYSNQLVGIEEIRDNEGVLQAKCSVCKEWFSPKRTTVEARAQFIKGNINRESRFYCSEECKIACPIFNKHTYSRGHNPRKSRNNNIVTENQLRIWSSEVLKNNDYLCEFCGQTATESHHVIPKKLAPFFALDPDNGVACCQNCHYKYGHNGSCSTVSLSQIQCS